MTDTSSQETPVSNDLAPEEESAPPRPHTIIDEIAVYANVVSQLRREFQFKTGEAVHLITTVMNYQLTLRQMAMQEQQAAMYRMPVAPINEEEMPDGTGE